MKKIIVFVLLITLFGCSSTTKTSVNNKKYGAFLGANHDNIEEILEYEMVSLEITEFTKDDIKKMKEKDMQIFAYLSVGSLEKYRDYYEEFKDLTFLDYDNWPEERWIDVSNRDWQEKLKQIALKLKALGADGIYMDNVDVYTIAKEFYGDSHSKIALFYDGLSVIIKEVNNCGLKVLMNGGSEFLEYAIEQNDDVVNYLYAYHQEEVFSCIDDYENDIFTTQDEDDSKYYQEIIEKASNKGLEIFILEYTSDQKVIDRIKAYCQNTFYYYCASSVSLK